MSIFESKTLDWNDLKKRYISENFGRGYVIDVIQELSFTPLNLEKRIIGGLVVNPSGLLFKTRYFPEIITTPRVDVTLIGSVDPSLCFSLHDRLTLSGDSLKGVVEVRRKGLWVDFEEYQKPGDVLILLALVELMGFHKKRVVHPWQTPDKGDPVLYKEDLSKDLVNKDTSQFSLF